MGGQAVTAGRAVVVGHLVVNTVTVVVMVLGAYLGPSSVGSAELGILIAVIPAWLWWSVAIPRWRRWALAGGADPHRLERLGVRTLLLWPKGSLFARTELPPRDP